MTNINKNNYEEFFIDYFDGNLDVKQQEELDKKKADDKKKKDAQKKQLEQEKKNTPPKAPIPPAKKDSSKTK